MKKKIQAFGHQINIAPLKNTSSDRDKAIEGAAILKEYFASKQALDNRIVENQKWYKGRYWDLFRALHSKNDPEPVTMYLFNTIVNKHADAMDNYPDFNILARKEMDKDEAQKLSEIVPMVYQYNRFRRTYSRAWWYKLKNGCAVYGQFWDPELMEGLGDISLTQLDILNLAWQPGISNIQDSRNFFIIGLEDNDLLAETYKDVLDEGELIDSRKVISPQQYACDDNIDTSKKSVLVDWYSRVRGADGRIQLHLTKFVGNTILFDSQQTEEFRNGIYDHGMYPAVFDVLFPEEGYPTGFGLVDIAKNPQMYVDKLDQIISKNALVSGKQRWIVKENGGINTDDFLDLSKDVIKAQGDVSELSIREFQAKPLDPFIVQHRQNKINELKEITSNDVFNSGEGGKGVTAASAIYALQEAGNKMSRDMIGESYENLTELAYLTVENIRQYYDQERDFRIRGEDGQDRYTTYSNTGIKPQLLPPAYEGEGMIEDPATGQMVPDPDYQGKYRKPIFDIQIVPEKQSPYSKVVHNEMAKEMFATGMFAPQRAPEALVALEMMSFEGKDKIMQKVSENGELMQQFQQIIEQMQQEQAQMWEIIQRLGGANLLKGDGVNGQTAAQTAAQAPVSGAGAGNPMQGV